MKATHQIIDLFPIPTFLFDKDNFEILHSNQRGLVLTQLNEQSIKSFKICDFIDKKYLKVGELENCCFKITAQAFTIGNLTVQTLDKEYLIVSFCSNTKVAYNSESLIDLSPDSIFIMQDGIIQYANPKLLSVFGYKLCELIGEKFTKFVVAEELKNTPIEYESKAKLCNGKLIDVDVSVINILFEEKPAYQVYLRDITARKMKESIQKMLLNLSKISFLNISLKNYLELMHKELKEIMIADNFYIALYDKTTDKYTFPYGVELFNSHDSDSLTDLHNTLIDFVRERKQGMLVTEKTRNEIYKKNKLISMGHPYRVWIGVPLIEFSEGKSIGVLALYDYNDANCYRKEDLQILELLASNIEIFIERINGLEKLRLAMIFAEEGENKYRSLFYDNKSVMFLVNPKTGDIVDANKSACLFYGYSFKQITSLKVSQINTLSEEEIKVEMNKSLKAKKQKFSFKHRLANGVIRDVEVYSGKVSLSGTELLYSTVHDVTERKLAKAKVYKLTASIEQSPLSVVITDLNGVIEYVNPYFSILTGYDSNELIGNNPKILNSGVQSKAFYKELWNTILAGNRWEGEICNKKKNGDLFWESAIISPLKNKNGEILNFVGIKEDISGRKKMIEELVLAKEKAEESDRLKSAFLANMSHEIRTPMNGILGFTNLLLEPNLDNDTKDEFIRLINQSGQRMLNTVNDLVEISKIEAGMVKVYISPINVYECINNLIGFFQIQAQKKGLALIFDVELSLTHLILSTDIGKLESILTNLIKNAIKFTTKGSITVYYIIVDGFVEFCIKDTGIGVSQHYLSAIFNRFQQADIGETRAFEGSGLGLAITKSYVEMLGGKIWIESIEDEGSQFYFTLPFSSKVEETSFEVEMCI